MPLDGSVNCCGLTLPVKRSGVDHEFLCPRDESPDGDDAPLEVWCAQPRLNPWWPIDRTRKYDTIYTEVPFYTAWRRVFDEAVLSALASPAVLGACMDVARCVAALLPHEHWLHVVHSIYLACVSCRQTAAPSAVYPGTYPCSVKGSHSASS